MRCVPVAIMAAVDAVDAAHVTVFHLFHFFSLYVQLNQSISVSPVFIA